MWTVRRHSCIFTVGGRPPRKNKLFDGAWWAGQVLAMESCARIGDRALLPLLPSLAQLHYLSVCGCFRVRP